ncbi:MAG: type IVB secretion system apparatus protein IcmL/DotI [Gammaproteobacteria bacterium]|nr:type IVB secretion system apparatus protein IcmL/DotI [Gammaproteobacteria bacterium]
MVGKGVNIVIQRNAFYRDSYRRALMLSLLLLLLNVFLGFSVVWRSVHPAPPQYFAATADGRLIHIHPLTDPAVTNTYVLQWTTDAVSRAFSQDFIHWRRQLQDIAQYFTPQGWKDFVNQMKASDNLKTLVDLKMVSNVSVTGAPKVVETAIINGHYAWKIQMPILVTYQNAARTIPQSFNVTVIVLRMPEENYPDRIAINNFLPEVTKNGAS